METLDRAGPGAGDVVFEVDFSHCSMRRARLANARLSGANFSGALLADADLTGADFRGASFSGAILTGVRLDGAGSMPRRWTIASSIRRRKRSAGRSR